MWGLFSKRDNGFTIIEIVIVLCLMALISAHYILPNNLTTKEDKAAKEFAATLSKTISKARKLSLIKGHSEIEFESFGKIFFTFGTSHSRFVIKSGRFTSNRHYDEKYASSSPASLSQTKNPSDALYEAISDKITNIAFLTDALPEGSGVKVLFFHDGFSMPFQIKFTSNGKQRSLIVDKFSRIKLQ
ncbi:MAG: hypothetical protein LBI56_03520 [Puniceicoccales bacterium]|jgi:Tfp pilus assembly protein FimT|nr:hypothetical protein [Puniceicoccales bacterium]